MIFDKYIALIIESIERYATLILTSTKEDNKILQSEIGALNKKYTDSVETSIASQKQLYEKIVELEEKNLELERENRTLVDVAEDANMEHEEVNEKWESLSEAFRELEEEQQKMSEETFEREERASKKLNEQRATIASLEHEVQSAKAVVKSLTERNTEAQAKQERLLQLVKEYDKATEKLIADITGNKSYVISQEEWGRARENLRNLDKPKPKMGRPKKQP